MLVTYKMELERLQAIKAERKDLSEKLSTVSRKDHEKLESLAVSIQVLDIESNLIKDNAMYLFFLEYMPQVIKILAKYDGKRYGEKTKDKIRLEIKDSLNIGFYISNSEYHQSITIYPLTAAGFTNYSIRSCESTEYSKENFILDSENKIRVNNPHYELDFHKNAVVDLDTRSKAWSIERSLEKAMQLEKELSESISEFNRMLPAFCNGIEKGYTRFPQF